MKLLIFIASLLLHSPSSTGFKNQQLKYPRVRQAYVEKEASIKKLFQSNEVDLDEMEIYLRAFKHEKQLELWAKNKVAKKFKLIKTYKVCRTCGELGPKRRQGDLQIPEGFYHIDAFNPASAYHLSMRINYPNKSDKILGYKPNLGGNICIHGACVTIGCLPLTDDKIKELYIICIEAKNQGQSKIPVTFYPAHLNDDNFKALKNQYSYDQGRVNLWNDLKEAYQLFGQSKQLPGITFLPDGRHQIQ